GRSNSACSYSRADNWRPVSAGLSTTRCCCVAIESPPDYCLAMTFTRSSPLLVLGRVRLLDLGQEPLDEAFGRLALGLGLEVGADAVAKHGDRYLAHVVQRDAEPAVHRGHRLTAQDQ